MKICLETIPAVSQIASTRKCIRKMKVGALLLGAGGLPAVSGTWYSDRDQQCPTSGPTLPATGYRDCSVSRNRCSQWSSVRTVIPESVTNVFFSMPGAFNLDGSCLADKSSGDGTALFAPQSRRYFSKKIVSLPRSD